MYRALTHLKTLGLAALVHKGGGRNRASVYQLETNSDAIVPSFEYDKGVIDDRKTVTPNGGNNGEVVPPQQRKQMLNSNSACVAANRSALESIGIGEPKLSELAALPGMTPDLIERVWSRVSAKGGGVGLLINMLPQSADQKARHEAEMQMARERSARFAAKRAREEQAAQKWLAVRSPEEIERRRAEYQAELKESDKRASLSASILDPVGAEPGSPESAFAVNLRRFARSKAPATIDHTVRRDHIAIA